MSELGIEGFEYATVRAGRSTYRVGTAGGGPALLLLPADPAAIDAEAFAHYRWADEVEDGPVPGGHLIPEEASDELTASLTRFLDS